ncbi:MAG: protein kinase, partial [Polyangiaceae bacterium]|nr:protein kinase [Polyangiaceae bacterium]
FILPGLGRMDAAARALDETIRRADERGDRLHLGSALNTRGLLRALRGDREGMIADLQRTISIGLELAQPTLELFGYYNLGEYLYLMDDLTHAAPNVQAAIRTATRQAGGQCPAVVSLLDARLRLYQGDEPAALEIVAGIRRQQEEARARGAPEGSVLAPSEEVLCDMVELSARDAAGPAWDELEARSARCSIGQEQIEVLEARAIAAARRGRLTEAAQQIEKAIRAAERIPSVMGARLAARRASILAAPPETLPPPG